MKVCKVKENRKEHKLLFKQKIKNAAILSSNLQEHSYQKSSTLKWQLAKDLEKQ